MFLEFENWNYDIIYINLTTHYFIWLVLRSSGGGIILTVGQLDPLHYYGLYLVRYVVTTRTLDRPKFKFPRSSFSIYVGNLWTIVRTNVRGPNPSILIYRQQPRPIDCSSTTARETCPSIMVLRTHSLHKTRDEHDMPHIRLRFVDHFHRSWSSEPIL